jgi:hypothetical protein
LRPSAAARLLLSTPATTRLRLRSRWLGVFVTAGVVAVVGAVLFFSTAVGWIFWFMLSGLAAPVLCIDGGVAAADGRKLSTLGAWGRAVRFATRGGLFAGRVRLLAYLPWLPVRLALALMGGGVLANLFDIRSTAADTTVDYALWIIINGVMYATIACIDAATLLEARMRVEGLDIAVHQVARRGLPQEAALAVPR